MKNGQKVFLVPGRSKFNPTGSVSGDHKIDQFTRSIIEEVTIISLHNSTGNAKVKDKRKRIFYCNPGDLTQTL